jgi:hypothetical protein
MILVRAQAAHRRGVPTTLTEITNRLNDIACQIVLAAELAALPASGSRGRRPGVFADLLEGQWGGGCYSAMRTTASFFCARSWMVLGGHSEVRALPAEHCVGLSPDVFVCPCHRQKGF